MAVLTHLVFLAADLVATDMDPMSWADFAHQLPLPKTHSTNERPETPQPTSQLSADLLAKFPWLAQTGVQPSTSDGGRSSCILDTFHQRSSRSPIPSGGHCDHR